MTLSGVSKPVSVAIAKHIESVAGCVPLSGTATERGAALREACQPRYLSGIDGVPALPPRNRHRPGNTDVGRNTSLDLQRNSSPHALRLTVASFASASEEAGGWCFSG